MTGNLTTKQRAALAAEMATMKIGDVKTQKNLGGRKRPSPMSNAEAAKAMGVGKTSVKRAKKLMKEDPEAHEADALGILHQVNGGT